MRFRWLHGYWLTLFFVLSITLCSLWLAKNGRLALYVHPRYILFTSAMSALAVLFVVVDIALRTKTPKAIRRVNSKQIATGAVCLAVCLGLLTTRPAGLTSSAAGQRGINSGALSFSSQSSLADLSDASADYETFTVKEWASLLVQTNNAKLFDGKPAAITGFVSPAPNNNPNVFYVARFVMTCCAVDARPIGVPVYQPNWRSKYQPDQWVTATGNFMQNPETSTITTVLDPTTITLVSEPAEPYVY
jgi:uncharacterized repeat protein (TIGR03943 family)